MGLSLRPSDGRHLVTEGMSAADIAEQYYEPPLINIISYACHSCPTKQYKVSNYCQNCLARSRNTDSRCRGRSPGTIT